MSWFKPKPKHLCQWVLIAKTVSPAPLRWKSVDVQASGSPALMLLERDSRAVTCFLFQCSDCKALRKEELWGQEPA